MVQVTYFVVAEMVCVRSVVEAMVAEGGWRRAGERTGGGWQRQCGFSPRAVNVEGRRDRRRCVQLRVPGLAKRPGAFAL